MKKEDAKFVPIEFMEFEFNNITYRIDSSMTTEQMEYLSELFDESQHKIIEEFLKLDPKVVGNVINMAGSVSAIFQTLRKNHQVARMVALVAHEKNKEWNSSDVESNEQLFKKLPYKIAEDVYGFFFAGGILQKIVIPSFFLATTDPPAGDLSSETSKD